MAQRQIPDRERLKLGVARAHAALVLVIELAQARGHLAAAGAGRGHNDEAARRLDVVVAAEAVVADDARDVGRVVRDDVVPVHADAERLEPALELFRRGLAAVVRDDDAADVQPAALECVDQAQGVVVVGDAEVAAALVALDIIRRDGDDDLRLVAHLHEHAHLAVGGEARQHARCVVVVKEFAAELQIQLAAELADALADLFRLHPKVFVVVKADRLHRCFSPLFQAIKQTHILQHSTHSGNGKMPDPVKIYRGADSLFFYS